MLRAGVWCLGSIVLLQQLVRTTHAHSFGARKLEKNIARGARLVPSDSRLSQRDVLSQRDLGRYGHYYPTVGE